MPILAVVSGKAAVIAWGRRAEQRAKGDNTAHQTVIQRTTMPFGPYPVTGPWGVWGLNQMKVCPRIGS